jgi:hypothetical protein
MRGVADSQSRRNDGQNESQQARNASISRASPEEVSFSPRDVDPQLFRH